jgi:hypothetical protein
MLRAVGRMLQKRILGFSGGAPKTFSTLRRQTRAAGGRDVRNRAESHAGGKVRSLFRATRKSDLAD